jgi:murein DD-endopeptidase MepM/ murein hydrolase activator NlpD
MQIGAMFVALIAVSMVSAGPWIWPLDAGTMVRPFQAPARSWGPGHRGIDIRGTAGQSVRAIGDGTVVFQGNVAEKPVVVVSHGAVRSTYEPVIGSRHRGAVVRAGDVIGILQSGHCSTPCLHLGLRRGDTYLDPGRLFQRVVLKSPARG